MVELEDALLEPVPPKSPINFWKAELSVDKVPDDKVPDDKVPDDKLEEEPVLPLRS